MNVLELRSQNKTTQQDLIDSYNDVAKIYRSFFEYEFEEYSKEDLKTSQEYAKVLYQLGECIEILEGLTKRI